MWAEKPRTLNPKLTLGVVRGNRVSVHIWPPRHKASDSETLFTRRAKPTAQSVMPEIGIHPRRRSNQSSNLDRPET